MDPEDPGRPATSEADTPRESTIRLNRGPANISNRPFPYSYIVIRAVQSVTSIGETMYGPDSIKVVDPLRFVRDHPGRFFKSGAYSAEALVAELVEEALLLGVRDLKVDRIDEWMLISAGDDWLANFSRDPFVEIISFKEGGVNSMLSEILATAFASNVVTITAGGTRVVKGTPPEWLDRCEKSDLGRGLSSAEREGPDHARKSEFLEHPIWLALCGDVWGINEVRQLHDSGHPAARDRTLSGWELALQVAAHSKL